MSIFQIDFEGDDNNLIGNSQDHVTASVDLGFGDSWNSFLIETEEHAARNPSLPNLTDSEGNVTDVSIRIEGSVAAYNTGWGYGSREYAPRSSYDSENVVSLLGDHIWFAQGRGTSQTVEVVFEGLDPGTYDLTSYVNFTAHNPIRTFDVTAGGETLRIEGQQMRANSGQVVSATENDGTIAGIEVGSDGVLVATYKGVPQSNGGMDPSIAGLVLSRSGDGAPTAPPPENEAPTAVDDQASTVEGTATTLAPLANDDDSDGDDLRIVSVGDASSGEVRLNANGTVTYVPQSGFFGTDSFSYLISDDEGGTDSGRVTVVVEQADIPQDPAPEDPSDGGPPADPSDLHLSLEGRTAFDGAPTSVPELLRLDDFTISAFVEFAGQGAVDNRDAIVGHGDYRNGNDLNFYGGKLHLFSSTDGSPTDVVAASTAARSGDGHHYAVTRENGVTKLYVDGVLEDTAQGWTDEFLISELGGGVQPGGLDGGIAGLQVLDYAAGAADIVGFAEDFIA